MPPSAAIPPARFVLKRVLLPGGRGAARSGSSAASCAARKSRRGGSGAVELDEGESDEDVEVEMARDGCESTKAARRAERERRNCGSLVDEAWLR